MRLNELTRPADEAELANFLAQRGWHRIGDGRMAEVWGNLEKSYVLKVWRINDKAYTAFLQFISNHPNKHFPKIRGKPIKLLPGYYAIRLEKLEPAEGKLHIQALNYADLLDELYYDVTDVEFNEKEINFMVDFENKHQSLAYAIALVIGTFIDRLHYFSDFTSANIMQRPNGDLVITDPVSSNCI